jgi:APA family basic amino acid/polyamine antiporter
MNGAQFQPFIPNGWGTIGVVGAASSIFFAYVGFDAVSTAAEETKNPQRNVPIGLIGSLLICTIFYLLVAAGAIGAIGAQPVAGLHGEVLAPGSSELAARCAQIVAGGTTEPLACSHEALAHVLRVVGWSKFGNMMGLAAFLALPSVVLMMMFGQTRVFFVMARDGLLPEKLASVHPKFKTPHIVTAFTGIVVTLAAAFLPVGKLADYSNSGTLFAFAMVAVSVLVLRRTDAGRRRPFRTPAVWLVAPLAIVGCVGLYLYLPLVAILVLPGWGIIGLIVYFAYSRGRSHVGRGLAEVHEPEIHDIKPPVPGTE